MITLLDKQKIILKHHHDGKSQRAIHRETGISRKTIRKYIKEYESKKAALIDSRNIPDGELIQSIVEKPTYDSSSRKKQNSHRRLLRGSSTTCKKMKQSGL